MSNPIDDYLELRKTASHPFGPRMIPDFPQSAGRQIMNSVGKGAVEALGASAIAGGAGLLGVAAMKAYRAVTKKRDFEQMLQANPDLLEMQEQHPEQFNSHYNSLRSMLPHFAADPVVAGGIMRQMSLNPGTAGGVLLGVMGDHSKVAPSGKLSVKGVGDASFHY